MPKRIFPRPRARLSGDGRVSAPTQASQLTEAIRRDIISGTLPPRSKLNLRELSAHYGAGVIPLREALSRLLRRGLVDVEDHRGFHVTAVSRNELLDITRARKLVEGGALRDAVQHGDLAWEARIARSLDELALRPMLGDDGTLDASWEDAHDRFHDALLSGCGSQRLTGFALLLREQTARYRQLSVVGERTPTRDVLSEHQNIAAAALARDATRAARLLCAHIEHTARVVLRQLEVL